MIKVCPVCGKEFKTSHVEQNYCCRQCAKSRFESLIGKRFGRLVVKKQTEQRKSGEIVWECLCDCGNITTGSTGQLNQGKKQSCGCLARESSAKRATKHGLVKTRVYRIYRHILDRCLNTNHVHYKNYGGRGITICQLWLDDFVNFYNWAIANGYQDGLSIDRIDVNGNYEPDNCRWSSNVEQSNNTRTNKYVTYNNETHTLADWARIIGINPKRIYGKLKHHKIEELIEDYYNHCKK